MLSLLRFIAIFEQCRAEHHHAHAADRVPGADARHFLQQHTRLGPAEAAATIFLRPGRRAPTFLAHSLSPRGRLWRLFRRALDARQGVVLALERWREIGLQPGTGV